MIYFIFFSLVCGEEYFVVSYEIPCIYWSFILLDVVSSSEYLVFRQKSHYSGLYTNFTQNIYLLSYKIMTVQVIIQNNEGKEILRFAGEDHRTFHDMVKAAGVELPISCGM